MDDKLLLDTFIKQVIEQGNYTELDRNYLYNRILNLVGEGVEKLTTTKNEIIDSLYINEFVLTDLQENGWVVRINDVVEETKKVISTTYKRFVEDVREIRNISSNGFTTQKVEDLYFRVDKPFRNWLSSIQIDDEKDMKIREWQKILKRLVRSEADNLLKEGSSRDYIGIVNKEKGTVKNIATAYETFNHWLIQSMK